MSLQVLAQELLELDGQDDRPHYWEVHHQTKATARLLIADPDNRVAKAAMKTCVRREVFEEARGMEGWASLAGLLDDARYELAEALGMTAGDFQSQGREPPCRHAPFDDARYCNACRKCGRLIA